MRASNVILAVFLTLGSISCNKNSNDGYEITALVVDYPSSASVPANVRNDTLPLAEWGPQASKAYRDAVVLVQKALPDSAIAAYVKDRTAYKIARSKQSIQINDGHRPQFREPDRVDVNQRLIVVHPTRALSRTLIASDLIQLGAAVEIQKEHGGAPKTQTEYDTMTGRVIQQLAAFKVNCVANARSLGLSDKEVRELTLGDVTEGIQELSPT